MSGKLAGALTGITPVYIMGVVNATLGLVEAFGISITENQSAAVDGFVNAVLVVVFAIASSRQPKPPA